MRERVYVCKRDDLQSHLSLLREFCLEGTPHHLDLMVEYGRDMGEREGVRMGVFVWLRERE